AVEGAAVEGVPVTTAETAVETIQREMTAFARRARASAGRMHPELSLVSYTLLGHLEERGGCRATDRAAHYPLDKSTASRTGAGGADRAAPGPGGPPGPGAASDGGGAGDPGPGHAQSPGRLPGAAGGLVGGGPGQVRRVPGALQRRDPGGFRGRLTEPLRHPG